MVEKRLEGTSDGSTAKELMKLAEKDPMTNLLESNKYCLLRIRATHLKRYFT